MKIGIFGGTFDPIHQGHLCVAQTALEQFQLQKVIFVPAYISPHKAGSDRKTTSAMDRYEMVRLAIDGQKSFEVFDGEIKRQGVSYTVDTLRELKGKYPNDEFYLILGEDSFQFFDTWKQVDEIRKMAHLLVAPREQNLKKGKMKNVSWIKMTPMPVSSSQLRAGKGEAVKFLPLVILNYISNHQLYPNYHE